MTLASPTRAVRNANPGNLRHVAENAWRGLADPAADDRGYCRFVEPKYGFRALISLLRLYGKRHGLKTIATIVPRFAPAADDNNEAAYIRDLEHLTEYDRRKAFNFDDATEMQTLARGIAMHESGGWFFETADLEAGCSLAFGKQE
jgi:hypothetical protein